MLTNCLAAYTHLSSTVSQLFEPQVQQIAVFTYRSPHFCFPATITQCVAWMGSQFNACQQGRLSPLTPWSKFPLPFSLPFLSFPLLLEVGPLIATSGSGERFSSPSRSGRSPAAKRYLVNFRLKISPLVATIFRSFSGNETSNYDRHVGCLLLALSQKLRGSALIINALPP